MVYGLSRPLSRFHQNDTMRVTRDHPPVGSGVGGEMDNSDVSVNASYSHENVLFMCGDHFQDS